MKKAERYWWIGLCLVLISVMLCGCGNTSGGKKEKNVRNNTAAITETVHYSKKEMTEALCGTIWEYQEIPTQPAKNYCFFEDGTFLLNYLGTKPEQLFPVGFKNDLYEEYGEWSYDEGNGEITIKYGGTEYRVIYYVYDGVHCLIASDWDPLNEGEFADIFEDDEDYLYDNTPYMMITKAPQGSQLLFDCPEGATVKKDLVGIWSTSLDDLTLAHLVLFKSDGTMYFSVNLGGSSITHKGLWAEKDGMLYMTYFDEYSGDSFDTLQQAKCWFAFDYTLNQQVMRCEQVFFDNDYYFYGTEEEAAL